MAFFFLLCPADLQLLQVSYYFTITLLAGTMKREVCKQSARFTVQYGKITANMMIQLPEISMFSVSYIKQGSVMHSVKYIVEYVIDSHMYFHMSLLHILSSSLPHTFSRVYVQSVHTECTHKEVREAIPAH